MICKNIGGKQYSEIYLRVDELVEEGRLQTAIDLLLNKIEAMEQLALMETAFVDPWHYDKLASLYKRNNQPEMQHATLKRFLTQPACPGASSRHIFEKYMRLNRQKKRSATQIELFLEYKHNISQSPLSRAHFTCSYCNCDCESLIPSKAEEESVSMLRVTCPYCHRSSYITVREHHHL